MKASKLSVLFAIIIVIAICEETKYQDTCTASALIDTRFKRQTIRDTHLQEYETIHPLGALKKPSIIRPLVSMANSLNPLRLSKQHIFSTILKKAVVSIKSTGIKINDEEDNRKIDNDSETKNTIEKFDNFIKNETTKIKPAIVAGEIVTEDHVILNDSDKVKDENSVKNYVKEIKDAVSKEGDLSKSLISELKSYNTSPLISIPRSKSVEQEYETKHPLSSLETLSIIRPLVSIANSLNPLRLPKQYIFPSILKKTVVPIKSTEIKINDQEDNRKIDNDSETKNTIEKFDNYIKNETTKIKPAIVAEEMVTEDHVILNDSDKVQDENSVKNYVKEIKDAFSKEGDLSKSLISELKSYKTSTSISIPRSDPVEKIIFDEPSAVGKGGRKLCADASAEVNSIPTIHGTGDKAGTKFGQFESFYNFNPFFANPQISLSNKIYKDHADLTSQKKVYKKDFKMHDKKEPDVNLILPKTEADKMIIEIQNNNSDERFESSATPQPLDTKVKASDLRPARNMIYINPKPVNAVHQYPSGYKKNNKPLRFDEFNNYFKPQLYNDRNDPVQYVFNLSDGIKNSNGQKLEEILFTTNAYQWNQNYNSYNQHQRGNFYDKIHGKKDPNRVWKGLKNNQVIMRPKVSPAGMS